MAMQISDHADLVSATRDSAKQDVWVDVSFDYQKYVALPELMRNARDNTQAGEKVTWQVKVTKTDTAQSVGLFQKRNVDVPMVLTEANVPWRHVTAYWVSNELEAAFQSNDSTRIVNVVNVRRLGAFQDLADQMERYFWAIGGSGDDPYGLLYYLVHNATVGQNGGHPTGFTDVAGISRTTYAAWKNWTGRYTNVSRTDFVRKARELANKSRFLNPYPNPTPGTTGDGMKMGYYTNYNVWELLTELAQNQNDRLGPDLTALEGRVLFHGNPIAYTPYLDSDDNDPFYGINWNQVKFTFLASEFMNELPAQRLPYQPRSYAHWIDTSFNLVCFNPREAGFEMSTAA